MRCDSLFCQFGKVSQTTASANCEVKITILRVSKSGHSLQKMGAKIEGFLPSRHGKSRDPNDQRALLSRLAARYSGKRRCGGHAADPRQYFSPSHVPPPL